MEMNGRKLGWIAIGIGVLALLVALSGRMQRPMWYDTGTYGGYGPSAQVAPPREGSGPRLREHQDGLTVQPRGPYGFGPHGFGPGKFFFAPFFWIGGLIRLALVALLVALLLRFLSRRSGAGGPPQTPGSQAPPQPRPGPEQPPYTGETKSL